MFNQTTIKVLDQIDLFYTRAKQPTLDHLEN